MKNISIYYEILMIKTKNAGHLCLVDRGSTDHVDSLFQDCMTHIVNFAYHNEHIYVYVFVCLVFVIYYDLQVHFHVMG